MEVNSLTLVEVMCYAQDDSFGIPVVSLMDCCLKGNNMSCPSRSGHIVWHHERRSHQGLHCHTKRVDRRQEYRLSVHGMCSYQIKTPCYNVSDIRAYQPCSIWHEPSGKRNDRPCYWFPCSCVQPPLHGEGIHVPPCLSMWGLL